MGNTFSGRYGSVQRILPTGVDSDGRAIWSQQAGRIGSSAYRWTLDAASTRWDKAAAPTVDGLQPNLSDVNYSNTVSGIQSWTFDNNTSTQSYTASNTRGFNAKIAGIRSCAGRIRGVGGFPPLTPGSRFLFRGFSGPESGNLEAENGGLDISGYVYQIAALVNNITISIDYGSFAPITWEVGWMSDWQGPGDEFLTFGIPTEDITNALGFFDMTSPACGSVIPSTTCMLRVGESVNDAMNSALDLCLNQANLTFDTTTQTPANSCSAGSGGWQSAIAGATDVKMSTTIHGSNFAVLHAHEKALAVANDLQRRSRLHLPGNDRYVRLYIGNDNACARNGAWEFNKMFVGSYTGLNVDLSSGSVLSFSSSFEFNAFPKTDDGRTCEKGFIKYRLPDPDRSEDVDWEDDGWVDFLDLRTAPSVYIPTPP